ncbi:MAG: HAD-IA family hydrolase [bacterium]|nr:HAD-IA family hydrolase [bacterium]MBU1917643.1 HAD-IA family hydrolase [bacterium]
MNIIFDLGGVLFSWNATQVFLASFKTSAKSKNVYNQLYKHQDWHSLNRGELKITDVAQRTAQRTNATVAEIETFLNSYMAHLTPLSDNIELIKQLKEKGHHLYCLSNMHTKTIEYLRERFSFFKYFNGQVISCETGLTKPDPKIYKFLLDKYQLDSKETIFIDDDQDNLIPAKAIGMRTVLYCDPRQCVSDVLAQINCYRKFVADCTRNLFTQDFTFEDFMANFGNSKDKIVSEFVILASNDKYRKAQSTNLRIEREGKIKQLEEHIEEVKKDFTFIFSKINKTAKPYITLLVGSVVLSLWIIYLALYTIHVPRISVPIITAMLLSIFVIAAKPLIATLKCPNCHRYLGNFSKKHHCPRCGVLLKK